MKCPLLTSGLIALEGFGDQIWVDCLEKECAWWDEPVKRCLLLNISEKLSLIYLELNDIAREMPHEKERLV
jgi:hypothetical protein